MKDFFFFLYSKSPSSWKLFNVNLPRSSKVPESILSMSIVSEMAACPPFHIADDSSALPSPYLLSAPPLLLFTPIPALICQLFCTTVLFKIFCYKIKNIFLIFFVYCLCEKYYKLITVQSYMADCVSWVPRLILLDLWAN